VVIVSGLTHFDAAIAFDFPPNAFTFSTGFVAGLGSAMLIAMYDFMGYYDICYVAGEVRNPTRVIPRAILWSIVAVSALYALMNLSIIAVVPWRVAMQSKFIVTDFMETLYGPRAASVVTLLVLWTALASVLALLLGYSRIAWAAASKGDFFSVFAKLHPNGQFLRRRPGFVLPFRMWLYPVPSVVALAGWTYVFASSGWGFAGLGVATVAAGVVAYQLRARTLRA
jgi:amino acid transporter